MCPNTSCDWISNNSANNQVATNCRSIWISQDSCTSGIPCLNRQGVDNTGSFSGNGKPTCWKEFEEANESILRSLVKLGKDKKPDEETLDGTEEFVCQLYQPKATIKTVKQLRWSLLKKRQAESDRISPTKAALHQAILRAHYQLMVWNNDHVPNPVLPSP